MFSINLSRNQIKMIAIILMIIDHFGAVFFPEFIFLRMIGRLSFPLFEYLIVDGILRTRNKGKMIFRLFILAFVSQLPFTLALYNQIFLPPANLQLNIFFELALGSGVIWSLESWARRGHSRIYVLCFLFLMGFVIGSRLNFIQYGYYGILMVLFFYILQERKELQITGFFVSGLLLLSIFFDFYNRLQWICAFAGLLLPMREVQKTDKPIGKWAYWIYPVHLLLFAVLKIIFL